MRNTFTGLFVLLWVGLGTCMGLAHHLFANHESLKVLEIGDTAKSRDVQGNDPWSPEELMQPEELANLLAGAGAKETNVLQIGIIHLYRLNHIPGSKFAGPASSAEGLDALKREAKDLSRTRQLVFYCGCCPWADCPNTRPAYKVLSEMGFKKIKVLYLAKNFTQDWVMKGYPVEKNP